MARANPGKLNYASLGNGSGTHITMELLKNRAKIFMLHIPYPGGVAAATAVATGDVQEHFAPISEVPTVAEQGFPGFDSFGWNGILAPAGTPREIIGRLNREINEIFQLADIRTLLA